MRITEAMVSKQLLHDITGADQRRFKLHSNISSGRRLNLPSDNPVDVVTAIRYRDGISDTQQYLSNVRDAKDWLTATDSALDKAMSLLHRARELAVTGSSDILAQDSREALADEITQIRNEMIQVGNISHGERFIFGGFQTLTKAFDDAGQYQGGVNTEQIVREVGPGVTMPINVVGSDVITPLMDELQVVIDHLRAGNAASVPFTDEATQTTDNTTYTISDLAKRLWDSGTTVVVKRDTGGGPLVVPPADYTISYDTGTITFNNPPVLNPTDIVTVSGAYSARVTNDLQTLDAQIDNLMRIRSQVGAKINRLDRAENRLQDMEISLRQLQSSVEDADIAQLAVQLAREETAYQASLAASARVIQATLLDFLK